MMSSLNHSASPMQNPLIVALDVDSDVQAMKLVDELDGIAGGFKLGPRLCLRYGQKLVQEIARKGPVFLDNKHLDIPSTMEAAVLASFEAGASLVTVHAGAGAEALRKMAALERRLQCDRPFRVLAVTILTSFSQDALPINFKKQAIAEHVRDLAEMVLGAGLRSLVCSPHELGIFGSFSQEKDGFEQKNLQNEPLYLVTPGIRVDKNQAQDQKRVMSPQEAIAAGASALVVGRPIIEAASPRSAAEEILKSFSIK